jgi:thymidylate synthase (FAD)
MENVEIPVLDRGYVKLIEVSGPEQRIIEAARMSTDKGFIQWDDQKHYDTCPDVQEPLRPHPGCRYCGGFSGDMRLLKFLYKYHHMTPFEMVDAVIEVQAPIFVFREWHRHRTQSYNELSARYTPLPDFNYMPTIERCMANSTTNKQASRAASAGDVSEKVALDWLLDLESLYKKIEDHYQYGLNIGIPKEVARVGIPVGRYSRMRAKADLRCWLSFLTLRSDKNPGAQWEIRQYANVVAEILAAKFPRTMEIYNATQ